MLDYGYSFIYRWEPSISTMQEVSDDFFLLQWTQDISLGMSNGYPSYSD
jgi:hypothetical protein